MQEIAVLASRALTTQRQFTAVADNVANVNTHGYRRMDMNFKEVLGRQTGSNPLSAASYVDDRSLTLDQSVGAMEQTGNPLDVALGTEGYFAISVNGTTHYTRRGQFVVGPTGTLVTPEGYAVQDNGGGTVQIPEGTKEILIGNDGTISTEAGQLARLGVFTFSPADQKLLQRTGEAAYLPTQGAAATPAQAPSVRQGFLEASNVNAVQEMVTMEQVSRAYQSALKALSSLEDTEQRAIRQLGRVQ
jgi:flagellar basal-body rod protein FlgF